MKAILRQAKLKKDLENYSKIVIYGAGYLAKRFNDELIKYGILADYCVVSSKDDSVDMFEHMPLYVLDDFAQDMQRKETITIIAATEKCESEMVKNLVSHNVKHYLLAMEYLRTDVSWGNYKEKPEKECLLEIAEWYVDRHGLTFDEIEIKQKQLMDIVNGKLYMHDKIAFVILECKPRTIKIAKALIEKGYKLELVFCTGVFLKDIFSKELKQICNNHKYCESMEELMYYLITLQAKVIHIFSHISYSNIVYFLIRNRNIFSKIVYDEYDIINEMYVSTYATHEQLKNEKYCLENASGLCCRGFEQEYLIDEKGYEIKGDIIQFFDWCQDELVNKKPRDNSRDLSICYAGGLASPYKDGEVSYLCFLEFAQMCEKNKCHFHVYPCTWDKQYYEEYIKMSSKNKYFHLHRPIAYSELANEISQYDYGVQLVSGDFNSREIDGYYKREKFIYAATNHFFDYLDAGLPIVAFSPIKFSQYFEDKGVLIRWTIEDYNFEELLSRRDELHEKAVEVKRKLCVSNKIDELIEFYNKL